MEIAIAIISSSALTAIISGVFGLIGAKKQKHNGVVDGVQLLLYIQIKDRCKECIKQGYVSHADYEDLVRMHKVYHDGLHGNGFLDDEMAKVAALPRV